MKWAAISLAVVASLSGAAAVEAATTQDRIVAELRDQGATRIEISRTLLGRTRIVAEGEGYEREIILNPASGVILRDFLKHVQDDGLAGVSVSAGGRDGGSGARADGRRDDSSGSGREASRERDDGGNSGSGSSGSGGGSDDDSDDDHSDDHSDNSGSGSDDSGSDDDSDDHDDDH